MVNFILVDIEAFRPFLGELGRRTDGRGYTGEGLPVLWPGKGLIRVAVRGHRRERAACGRLEQAVACRTKLREVSLPFSRAGLLPLLLPLLSLQGRENGRQREGWLLVLCGLPYHSPADVAEMILDALMEGQSVPLVWKRWRSCCDSHDPGEPDGFSAGHSLRHPPRRAAGRAPSGGLDRQIDRLSARPGRTEPGTGFCPGPDSNRRQCSGRPSSGVRGRPGSIPTSIGRSLPPQVHLRDSLSSGCFHEISGR